MCLCSYQLVRQTLTRKTVEKFLSGRIGGTRRPLHFTHHVAHFQCTACPTTLTSDWMDQGLTVLEAPVSISASLTTPTVASSTTSFRLFVLGQGHPTRRLAPWNSITELDSEHWLNHHSLILDPELLLLSIIVRQWQLAVAAFVGKTLILLLLLLLLPWLLLKFLVFFFFLLSFVVFSQLSITTLKVWIQVFFFWG